MSKNGKRAFIGIDIGGTKSLLALFDESFEAIAQEKFRSQPEKGELKAFSKSFDAAVKSLLEEAKKRSLRVTVVGAGCAGEIDLKTGVVRESPNLEFLAGYDLHHRLEKLTETNVFVANDVLAAVYGEFRLGAARKARHVIGVWIGTGVGGALVIDERVHLGASGAAGDIGNYLLHAAEPSHEAPRKEVLDNVASRTAIAGDAAALAAKRHAPELLKLSGTDVTDIKSGDIAEAIRRGDKMIEKLVRSRARVVGAAISNMVDFLNPDMVLLGGGLVEALPSMMKNEVRDAIEAHCAPRAAKAVEVQIAKFKGHAGTVGAAKLALDMFSDDPPIDRAGI